MALKSENRMERNINLLYVSLSFRESLHASLSNNFYEIYLVYVLGKKHRHNL